MKKARINVPSSNTQQNHKKAQNVTETLKKLKKMHTSNLTISKTFVPNPKPVRRCKIEPKRYRDDDDDDNNDNDYNDNGSDFGLTNIDDVDNDPNFNGAISDGSASDDDYDNDNDDEDYKPYSKKTRTSNKSQHEEIKPKTAETNSKFTAVKVNAPPVFLCMKCKNKFQTLADLKQHVFQKNQCTMIQMTCKLCDKTFENKKRLAQHIKTHAEKAKFICDQCGKTYTNQYNLENHKSSQHGEYVEEAQESNIYKCRLCNEKFTNRTDLYAHMKIHAKEPQQLLCDTCGKCFKNAHNLNSHIRIHLDIRPFECALCPKRFRTRLLLKQHLHVHTGIKEFQCAVCNQSFAKQDSLRLHMKKRHADAKSAAPIECPIQAEEEKNSTIQESGDLKSIQTICTIAN